MSSLNNTKGKPVNPVELDHFSIRLGSRLLYDIDAYIPVPGTSSVIIGPTGSGKSVLLKAIAGLLPTQVFTLSGNLKVFGQPAWENGLKAGLSSWSKIRHLGMTFVPAETAQAMNPSLSLEQNQRVIAPEARTLIQSRLKQYFNLDFDRFAKMYPDEVSGGELQRITLMILLARDSSLILLDEPTVNLDRQLRKRFLEFLNSEILGQNGKTVLMASHDLDFVRGLKLDAIVALEEGKLISLEELPASEGYDREKTASVSSEALVLSQVDQHYMVRGLFGERPSWAFKGLNIAFKPGHIYGITGPSGCGKTSMIKAILRLLDGTSGLVSLEGTDLVALKPEENGEDPEVFKPFRKKIAIVQQDSRFSFFPDLKIRDSLKQIYQMREESFDLEAFEALMDSIKLRRTLLDCLPQALSSGEMKRMDIVRILAAKPEVILLDEPFAHIDFETRGLVMQAIAAYLEASQAILIVVTHEDFDLKHFVETDYDFLSMLNPAS